jgi:hypothetical protein
MSVRTGKRETPVSSENEEAPMLPPKSVTRMLFSSKKNRPPKGAAMKKQYSDQQIAFALRQAESGTSSARDLPGDGSQCQTEMKLKRV